MLKTIATMLAAATIITGCGYASLLPGTSTPTEQTAPAPALAKTTPEQRARSVIARLEKNGVVYPSDLREVGDRADVQAAIKQAGTIARWPATNKFHDAEVEAAMTATATTAGFEVLRTGLYSPAWQIDKNEYDMPKQRVRGGDVLVRAKGEDHCRLYSLNGVGDYNGAGYEATTVPLHAEREWMILSCP